MPIFGLGLHIIVAIFFAIHAVRSGRQLYWLMILFIFPLLGSIVYFAVVFLPAMRLDRGLRKAGAAVQKTLDPGRDVRAAQDAFDLTPTAFNQIRLANALLEAGQIGAAVAQFDACLRGPFANDAEFMLGAARAKLANRQPQEAAELLTRLRCQAPTFRPEQLGLALAGALAGSGRKEEADAVFSEIAERFGSVEARAEYAIWALSHGDIDTAERQIKELDHSRKHMSKHVRGTHQSLFRRLDAALAQLHRAQ